MEPDEKEGKMMYLTTILILTLGLVGPKSTEVLKLILVGVQYASMSERVAVIVYICLG